VKRKEKEEYQTPVVPQTKGKSTGGGEKNLKGMAEGVGASQKRMESEPWPRGQTQLTKRKMTHLPQEGKSLRSGPGGKKEV